MADEFAGAALHGTVGSDAGRHRPAAAAWRVAPLQLFHGVAGPPAQAADAAGRRPVPQRRRRHFATALDAPDGPPRLRRRSIAPAATVVRCGLADEKSGRRRGDHMAAPTVVERNRRRVCVGVYFPRVLVPGSRTVDLYNASEINEQLGSREMKRNKRTTEGATLALKWAALNAAPKLSSRVF